jgi:hypothetical protein
MLGEDRRPIKALCCFETKFPIDKYEPSRYWCIKVRNELYVSTKQENEC